jgi:hypothetical protein
MIAEPKGNMDQSKWLSTWSKLYYEVREAGVPDVCYQSDQHKKDRAPVWDFLRSIKDDDPFFYDLWKNKLRSPELQITFVGILDEYRIHRPEEKSIQNPLNSVSFNATLNGQTAESGQLPGQQGQLAQFLGNLGEYRLQQVFFPEKLTCLAKAFTGIAGPVKLGTL